MADPAAPRRIGFVGLGNQGGPIAHRIVDAGLPLTVWARRADALAPYVAKGAIAATDLAELGAACDHVGVCVFDDADVIEVCDRLIPAMRRGSLLVIHATVLPETCVALADRAAACGIDLIDAPVSGGARVAARGDLTVMCGGPASAVAAGRPVFETFGREIVHLGGIGAGQRAKILNNGLLSANIAMAHAALSAGVAAGLDRDALVRALRSASGYSKGLEAIADAPDPRTYRGLIFVTKDTPLLAREFPGDADAAAIVAAAQRYLDAANG